MNILFYLDVDWYSPNQKNRQHFLLEALRGVLPRESKIFVVERPLDLIFGPLFKTRKFYNSWLKNKLIKKLSENMILYTPQIIFNEILTFNISFLRKINSRYVNRQMKSLLTKMEVIGQPLITIIQHPYQIGEIQWVKSDLIIYDCHDEYSKSDEIYPGQNKGIEKREKALLKKVDLVTTVSFPLFDKIGKYHNQVLLLSNAYDQDHSFIAKDEVLITPEEVACLSRPIVGFVGKLSERLDYNLILKVIKEMPDVFFLFIGPIEKMTIEVQKFFDKTRNRNNFKWLGPKPYTELPNYIKCMDLGIIPYIPNTFNLSSDPLKIYEFLGAGKKVICTGIFKSSDVPGVKICNTPEEFLSVIRNTLKNLNQSDILSEYKIPSWSSQVTILYDRIKELLAEKEDLARKGLENIKLSIIIPVYNEENTINELLERVDSVNIDKEIIVVDDGSIDGTRQILEKIKSISFKLIFHQKNMGKGFAIRTALKYITGDIVIIQDGDLEYDPQEYKILIEPIINRKAKIVYGSRQLMSHDKSYYRYHFGGIFLSFLTRLLFKTKITDEPTCYKVFTSDVIKNIILTCKKFEFCPEITAKVLRLGYQIHEVPIHYSPRTITKGKKIRSIDGLVAVWTLLKYRFVLKSNFTK